MPRARTGLALAIALLVALPIAPPPAPDPASADAAPAATTPAATASAIQPGSVGRTSVAVSTRYDVDLAVRYSDRAVRLDSTATVTNTSGGPIDRLELNTVAARLGAMTLDRVTVDGRRV